MFSTTQGNNIAIFAGLISIILAKFKIAIGTEEIQTFLGLGVSLIGTILQWIHRYKKGDLTMGGMRKIG